MTPTECAYCGTEDILTREHLWPKCLIKRTRHQSEVFLKVACKIIRGEPTIKDVCIQCNNKYLSELDNYICCLFDNYFTNVVRPVDVVNFSFNHNYLSRWLLKTLYNSKRANIPEDAKIFHQYKRYMMHGQIPPKNLFIFLQLIIPYKIKEKERHLLSKKFQHLDEIPPDYARTGRISSKC